MRWLLPALVLLLPSLAAAQNTCSGSSNVAIFQDSDPFGQTATQTTLDAIGIPWVEFGAADMGVVDLSGFDRVVLSSDQDQAFYTAMEANVAWFEAWADGVCCRVLQLHGHVGTTGRPSGPTRRG